MLGKSYFVDIDECADEIDNCNANADCTNTDGSFYCACQTGYTGDGHNCEGRRFCLSFVYVVLELRFSL